MVQSIDDVSDVFAHITVYIIRFLKKLRCLVYKVGGQEVVEETFLISLVELVHTVGEKTKSSTDEDAAGFSLFSSVATSIMLSPEEIISSMMTISLPSTSAPRNS